MISARLPADLVTRIDGYSKAFDITRSDLVAYTLDKLRLRCPAPGCEFESISLAATCPDHGRKVRLPGIP